MTYLVDTNKRASTVKSYISAIKAILKDDGQKLNEDQFVLNSLTRACRLTNNEMKARLPIHKGMLSLLLSQIKHNYLERGQIYLSHLYESLLLTAYFGLFRVSELTATKSGHAVLAKDVQIGSTRTNSCSYLDLRKRMTSSQNHRL